MLRPFFISSRHSAVPATSSGASPVEGSEGCWSVGVEEDGAEEEDVAVDAPRVEEEGLREASWGGLALASSAAAWSEPAAEGTRE